jgi:hypothetical protein
MASAVDTRQARAVPFETPLRRFAKPGSSFSHSQRVDLVKFDVIKACLTATCGRGHSFSPRTNTLIWYKKHLGDSSFMFWAATGHSMRSI